MSNSPTVGVIIANHNYGEWLIYGINSIFQQTYPQANIRIGVFHDACTDGSAEMVLQMPQSDRVLQIENNEEPIGPGLGRNKVIEAMWDDVDCFMVLDADDYYGPNKISRSVEEWLKEPDNIGVVYSDHDIWHVESDPTYRVDRFLTSFNRRKLQRNNIVHSNSLISKAALSKCGLYEDIYPVEDYDLWLRISKHFMIIHIPEILMTQRVTGKNSSFTCSSEVWQNRWRQIQEKHGSY